MIKSLPADATAEDVVGAVAAELTHRMAKDNCDSPVIEAYAVEVIELFKLTVPTLLAELAHTHPTLVLALCEQWAGTARENVGEPQPVLGWDQRFEQALRSVYTPAEVATLLEAEGIGALSTILRKRVEVTGEDPRVVLKRLDRDDRAFALVGADAPGAFLANRVRGLSQ